LEDVQTTKFVGLMYAKSLLCTNNLAHTTAFKLKNVQSTCHEHLSWAQWKKN